VGNTGGFIPQNDSGIYGGGAGRAYGNQANWNISTAGYAGVSGGHPAALLAFNNGQVENPALYRVAVPGQPQLNTMDTALNMGTNDITGAGTVNAQQVTVANTTGSQAVNLGVGSVVHYDSINQIYSRSDAGTVISNSTGSNVAPLYAGATSINGPATITGSTTMGANTEIYNPGTQYIETGGGNLYLKPYNASGVTVVGGGGGSGQLVAYGAITAESTVNLAATANAGWGCSSNGITTDPSGNLLSCKAGVWRSVASPQPVAYGTSTSDAIVGPFNWCYLQGFDNPQSDGTGLWEVELYSDGGPNNRYFFFHNSKGGGSIQYACF
jgi:hypothetical protein